MPLLQAPKQLPAVGSWHDHVEEDELGRLVVDRRERRGDVLRLADGVTRPLETDPQELAQRGVVVDDQDEWAAAPLSRA